MKCIKSYRVVHRVTVALLPHGPANCVERAYPASVPMLRPGRHA